MIYKFKKLIQCLIHYLVYKIWPKWNLLSGICFTIQYMLVYFKLLDLISKLVHELFVKGCQLFHHRRNLLLRWENSTPDMPCAIHLLQKTRLLLKLT